MQKPAEEAEGSLKKVPFITTNKLGNYPEVAEKKYYKHKKTSDLIFKWDIMEFLAPHQSHC